MAVERSLDGNANSGLEGNASTNETTISNGNAEAKKTKTIPFHKLFSFADSTDITLMIFGTIGAIANGLGSPLMTIVFGDLIDSFGNNKNLVHEVSKVKIQCISLFYEVFSILILDRCVLYPSNDKMCRDVFDC